MGGPSKVVGSFRIEGLSTFDSLSDKLEPEGYVSEQTTGAIPSEAHASSKQLDLFQVLGVSLAIVPAVGYLIGYVAVNNTAHRLGLAVSDFKFSFRDFLLLPGMLYLVIAAAILLREIQLRWDESIWAKSRTEGKKKWEFWVGLVGGSVLISLYIYLMAVATAGNGAPGLALAFAGVVVASVLMSGWPIRDRALSGLLAVIVVAAAVSALTIMSSLRWAEELTEYSNNRDSTPSATLSPGYVLNPQTGILCVNNICRCRVRVSPNVIGSPSGFEVVPEIDSFTPERCEPKS